jgi:hypothetical protein
MLKLLSRALGGLLLVVLAGCCANNPCDCQDLLADSLYFAFKTTGPNAFSLNEIQNVYLARYDSTKLTVSRDSLPLPITQRTTQALRNQIAKVVPGVNITGLLVLSNNAPFVAASSTAKLSGYVYRLYVPQDSTVAGTLKKHSFTTFTLDRIRLIGRYQADGCCTCYENSFKRVRVTGGNYPSPGAILNVTESGQGSERKPVVIQLSK